MFDTAAANAVITMIDFFNIRIESEEIVSFLKREIYLRTLCERMLRQHVIDRAAQDRNIVITPHEVQAEADRQRHERRLESAADTLIWLEEELITPEDWETGIRDRLLTQKLAESLFSGEVEKYFTEHQLDFERISLYKIMVPYEQLAQELFYQIEEGEIGFYEAAHLYDLNEQRRLQCGYEGRIYRWDLPPETAAIIFGEKIGQVIGPLKVKQGYELLIAEELITAELTPEVRQEIIDTLFQGWLERELNYLLHQGEA